MKPKELEKRLSTAYDAGYFDGYCAAIDRIHQDWASVIDNTKRLGPVLRKRVYKQMTENYSKMRKENINSDEETRELVNG